MIKEMTNKTKKFALRFLRRHPNLIFHSPQVALTEMNRKSSSNNINQLKVLEVENKLIDKISIHEEVILYPLVQKKNDQLMGEFYSGGLIDSRSHKLIESAIHYNGVSYCQELPNSYKKGFIQDCLEIKNTVLFGGIIYNHFGHFLAESLGRLYAYKFVREYDPYILYYAPWGVPNYLEKNNYVNQILSGFNIPLKRLVFINRVARLRKALIPNQEYGFGYMEKPDPIFLDFIKTFKFKADIPKGFENADKIYVSRAKLPNSKGKQIGENLFEEYLKSNGYTIFYPESYNLFEQLTLYKNAKKIIFSDGSAVLACILLPDLMADVAIVARRRDPHRNIRLSTDCFKGYGKNILWIDAISGQYQFGLGTWDALSEINWYEVSTLLKSHQFVDTLFNDLDRIDYSNIVRYELRNYIEEVSRDREFIDFMMNLKEVHPLWEGLPHIVDPRK
jgi:hypothetical protein